MNCCHTRARSPLRRQSGFSPRTRSVCSAEAVMWRSTAESRSRPVSGGGGGAGGGGDRLGTGGPRCGPPRVAPVWRSERHEPVACVSASASPSCSDGFACGNDAPRRMWNCNRMFIIIHYHCYQINYHFGRKTRMGDLHSEGT